MKLHITQLLEGLNLIAPFGLAESWDNVGLLIGAPEREVHSLLLGLDPTLSLLDEAITRGIDTIITHHPCIFRPFSSINLSTPDGVFLERALGHKINVIACHTNFDNATAGVSDALCKLLKLEDIRPLRPTVDSEIKTTGSGRIGEYKQPLSFTEFTQRCFQALTIDTMQVAGIKPSRIQRVALCGGSGSDLAADSFAQNADIYISSEIKHSTAVWAQDVGFCLINGTHYATEKPAMLLLEQQLIDKKQQYGWDVDVYQSTSENAPFVNIYP